MSELRERLLRLEAAGDVPRVTAYNRLDGPGSSLDLREFQEAFWSVPEGPIPEDEGAFAKWSKNLPRTVGITIDVGCRVEAWPLDPGQIGIVSHDYAVEQQMPSRHVPYRKELWLSKLLDIFGLSGVRMVLHNLVPGVKSSGLGGSATATTGVCLLANALVGQPFTDDQLVAMASLVEQDMGVSITGTQEQANVVYGGVTDYVWFPWGIPGGQGGYGTSVRRTLLPVSDYPALASRLRVYHSGKERASSDVNAILRGRLSEDKGYEIHLNSVSVAYEFREGLRTKDWATVRESVRQYVKARVALCPDYMTSACWDIQGQCEKYGAESFPLGAGGGGAVLVFSPSPDRLRDLDKILSAVYRRVDFELRSRGHEYQNVKEFLCRGEA